LVAREKVIFSPENSYYNIDPWFIKKYFPGDRQNNFPIHKYLTRMEIQTIHPSKKAVKSRCIEKECLTFL
jgi:hypothetical protein